MSASTHSPLIPAALVVIVVIFFNVMMLLLVMDMHWHMHLLNNGHMYFLVDGHMLNNLHLLNHGHLHLLDVMVVNGVHFVGYMDGVVFTVVDER